MMNCTKASMIASLLRQLVAELQKANTSSPGRPPDTKTTEDAYLYILVIMIFYAFLAGGLVFAYSRSRKQESKSDPYHLYIETDWSRMGAAIPDCPEGSSLAGEKLLQ
nr:PREDICTED: potassium voltage-gated channel subfamily E regulatory beta subunit 5 [Latimeria chalumnae]|eukprot:XP_005998256.1 PREDICTED: potassium voltage-gated channel subfamily E regulatory beta subunit 5 [Latimeria chalumnae]